MKFLRYGLLMLIILGLPTFFWANYGDKMGNVFSTMLLGCLVLYYVVVEKNRPAIPFLLLGIFYYSLSGLGYSGSDGAFINDTLKYFVFILAAFEISRRTTSNEFFVFLLLGTISIIVHTLFFPSSYGRYSGLFINPNGAGFICTLAFSLVFTIKKRMLSLVSQGIIVICAILTFSRTALLLIVLIYILSILINRKNLVGLVFGALAFIIIISSTGLRLNTVRLNAFKSIFTSNVDTQALGEQSRNETWALYTEMIMDNVAIGNGFKSMQGGKSAPSTELIVGVHNTYLMIVGESGVLPFITIIAIYIFIFVKSIRHYKDRPELIFISASIIIYMLTAHNYFDNHIILFSSLWLYHQVNQPLEINQPNIS